MVRLGYKGMSSLCECNMSTPETVTHMLAECPCYVEQRRALESSLSKLRLSREAKEYINKIGLARVILMPEFVPKVSLFNKKKIHKYTGRFINAVYTLRPTHF